MRLSVFAVAGAALLAVSTTASADDNGALTGAAGRRNGSRRRWASRSRRGRCGRCGRGWRCDRRPATCCCRTCAMCEQNYNDDEQQYGR